MGRHSRYITSPLYLFRQARTLTQQQAAALVGISQAHWTRLEHGTSWPSRDLAKRLSGITGIAGSTLLGLDADDVACKNEHDSSAPAGA